MSDSASLSVPAPSVPFASSPERRAWILLIAPPILLLALTIGASFVVAWTQGTDPSVIRAGVMAWLPYILMVNHTLLFLIFLAFVRADGTPFSAVGWGRLAGARALSTELGAGVAAGIVLGLFNTFVLSRLLYLTRQAVGGDMPGRFSSSSLPEASFLPFLLAATLFAGIVEESVYRGYAITHLRPRLGLLGAVMASTLLFGPLHFGAGWTGMLGASVMGALLAGVFLWRRHLLAAAVAHAVVNAIGLLL